MSAILAALAAQCDAYRAIIELPDGATDSDVAPLHAQHDEAINIVRTNLALTPIEAAAKLRTALQAINGERVDTFIIYGMHDHLDEDVRATGKLMTGEWDQNLIWETIRDLEAMAFAPPTDAHKSATDLYPGLRRATAICFELARESDALIEANPGASANKERRARSGAFRRAAGRIMDVLQDEARIRVSIPRTASLQIDTEQPEPSE